jgi:outer membrane protein
MFKHYCCKYINLGIFIFVLNISIKASDAIKLTLSDMVTIGIKNCFEKKDSDIGILIQKRKIKSTISSFFPEIRISGAIQKPFISSQSISIESKSQNSLVDSLVQELSNQLNMDLKENLKIPQYQFQVVLNQPIFTGGRIKNTLLVANKDLEIAEKEALQKAAMAKFKACELYWYYLFLEQQLKVNAQNTIYLEENTKNVATKFNIGQITRPELDEVSLKDVESQKLNYELSTNLIRLQNEILIFLNLPLESKIMLVPSSIDDQATNITEFSIPQADSIAGLSLEYQIMVLNAEKMKTLRKVEESNYYPTINGFAGVSYYKQNDVFVSGDQNHDISIGLNLSWLLFDFGKRSNAIKNVELTMEREIKECEYVRKLITTKVICCHRELMQSRNNYNFVTKDEERAKNVYDESLKKSNLGEIEYADMLKTKIAYEIKLLATIKAKYDFQINQERYFLICKGYFPLLKDSSFL